MRGRTSSTSRNQRLQRHDRRGGQCRWPRGRGVANRRRRGRGRHHEFYPGHGPPTRDAHVLAGATHRRRRHVGLVGHGAVPHEAGRVQPVRRALRSPHSRRDNRDRVGSTTFMDRRGLRVDNNTSWLRYVLASTLTSGEISVEVEGLHPDNPGMKSRIFSMMDGGSNLFKSVPVQRAVPGRQRQPGQRHLLQGADGGCRPQVRAELLPTVGRRAPAEPGHGLSLDSDLGHRSFV